MNVAACFRKLRRRQKLFFTLCLSVVILVVLYRNKFTYNEPKAIAKSPANYLKSISEDINATLRGFKMYARFVNAMSDKLDKDSTAAKLKELKEEFTNVECGKTPPFLLIVVHSRPDHFIDREAIRLSWGNQSLSINYPGRRDKRSYKTVFLLGQTQNTTTQRLVQMEAHKSRDIVVGNFMDSFANLYRKMLLSIEWSLKHCHAKYMLKTDEDCYVNTDILLSLLNDYDSLYSSIPLYAGRKTSPMIERDPTNRYYVPKEIYPSAIIFPPYISGGGYLFSGSLLEKLHQASRTSPLFAVEDACFGSLMRKVEVPPRNDRRFLPFVNCFFLDETKHPLDRPMCEFLGPAVIHGLVPSTQIYMHFKVKLMTFAPFLCQGDQNRWLRSREICEEA